LRVLDRLDRSADHALGILVKTFLAQYLPQRGQSALVTILTKRVYGGSTIDLVPLRQALNEDRHSAVRVQAAKSKHCPGTNIVIFILFHHPPDGWDKIFDAIPFARDKTNISHTQIRIFQPLPDQIVAFSPLKVYQE
jgi:hypothetical protein